MIFNTKITEKLKSSGTNVNECLTTLLILYHNLENGNMIMKDSYISSLSYMGIIEYDFFDEKYVFLIPLFQDEDSKAVNVTCDDFIKEYIRLFSDANRERRASLSSVKERMKKLFEKHRVTREEIMDAARLHISRSRSPEYIKQADYFIWKQNEGFNIMKYIEEIRENGTSGTNGKTFDVL